MLRKFLGLILFAIAAICAYVAIQPSHFSISRELLIKTTPEVLFPYINNSKMANDWMPWRDSDPGVQMQYSGPDEGVGSISSWESKGHMGTGRAEVVESVPLKVVKTQLTYTRPMNMTQLAEISLTPLEGGTLVRWSVSGENTFFGRLVCLFMNMDKTVGGEFEKGLIKLNQMVKKA